MILVTCQDKLSFSKLHFLFFKTMIECVFCYSSSKDNYLFTECCHLVCIDCASAKWDRRFSLKCCEQVTFLSEETSDMLA